jgi:hypothetical protein
LDIATSTWELRVVDTGTSLALAKVVLDPQGDPFVTVLEILETDTLADMRDIIDAAVVAVTKPVINMRNLV